MWMKNRSQGGKTATETANSSMSPHLNSGLESNHSSGAFLVENVESLRGSPSVSRVFQPVNHEPSLGANNSRDSGGGARRQTYTAGTNAAASLNRAQS